MKTLIEAEKFTAWYDSAEDRLRVAINIDSPNARVDFWITRRFFLSLITQIEGLLDTQELGISKSEIDSMIEEGHPEPKAEDNTSNEDIIENKESQKPIETKDTQKSEISVSLLRNMDISVNKRENRVKLKLSSDCCEAEANLTLAAMSAFIKMLILQAPTVEWGISSMMFHR